MAQFHWSMTIIGRSKGCSVDAAAAYRAGERLHDERSGLTHDYRHRRGVEHNKIARYGLEHPHCHAFITMCPLSETGFGPKARHD